MTGVLTPFPPLYAQIVNPTRYGKYAVTVQTILRFPDHHLRATAQRIVVFDEDLCSFATDLLDTLRTRLTRPCARPSNFPSDGLRCRPSN
jgi:hypothetical protein